MRTFSDACGYGDDEEDKYEDGDDDKANLFRHLFHNSGALGDAVGGALLLSHYIVGYLVIIVIIIVIMIIRIIILMIIMIFTIIMLTRTWQ